MKYLLIILFFYNASYLNAQVHEYLYVSDIKFEEYRPNTEFFVPVSSHSFKENVNTDSLLLVINDTTNRIYYAIAHLYDYNRNQSKIDSIENLVESALKSPRSDTLLFSRKENILIIKILLSNRIKSSVYNVNKKLPVPKFFIREGEINRTFTKVDSINFLD